MNNIKVDIAKISLQQQGLNSEQSEPILNTAINLFQKVPNKHNSVKSNVGLLVGKVQSGKTSIIIATSAIAFENGTKVIVALLSDTEILLTQNKNRIQANFAQWEDIHVYEDSNNGDFSQVSKEDLDYMYQSGDKIFICSLKNKKRIGTIIEKLQDTGYQKEDIIIFDDEGDDVSQNVKPNKKKFLVLEDGPKEMDWSATNKAIKQLKENFSRVGYVSVTATPESIIYLQTFQHLAPDYIVTCEPGIGYCGLSYFHYEHRDDLITVIDGTEECLNQDKGIPKDLKIAFAHFIAGAIYRKKHETEKFKHSMMVHTSRIRKDHESMCNKISTYCKQIKNGLRVKNSYYKDFLSIVEDEYSKISKTKEKFTNKDFDNVINFLKITPINMDSDIKDIQSIMKVVPYHLFVGGDLLDRGVTISGLSVVYISRDAKRPTMDTQLQRARWFGYKSKYINTCQIYMTQHLDECFNGMVETDNQLWDILNSCYVNNISPKSLDFELEITVDGLSLSSSRKASFSKTIVGINVEQQYIPKNLNYIKENLILLNNFWSENSQNVVPIKYGPQIHDKLTIKFGQLVELLNKWHFSDSDKKCQLNNLLSFASSMLIDENSNIEILKMIRPEQKEERSTLNTESNKLVGLLQGYSVNKNPNDPNYYKGDRYLVEDKLMVQFHLINLKNDICIKESKLYIPKGTIIPMIAWFFPKSSYKKMIVTRKKIG